MPGYVPATWKVLTAGGHAEKDALRTPQWYLLTAILTLNVTSGIALISQALDHLEYLRIAEPTETSTPPG